MAYYRDSFTCLYYKYLTIWQRNVDSLFKPPPEGLIYVPGVVGGSKNHYNFVIIAEIQKTETSETLTPAMKKMHLVATLKWAHEQDDRGLYTT
jgi:hypothetical protein